MPDTPLDLATAARLLTDRYCAWGYKTCDCTICLARRLLAELSARDAENARLRGLLATIQEPLCDALCYPQITPDDEEPSHDARCAALRAAVLRRGERR